MKTALFCLVLLSLAACGASGGLYLPDDPNHKSHNPLKKEQRKTDGQPAPAPDAPPQDSPQQAPQ